MFQKKLQGVNMTKIKNLKEVLSYLEDIKLLNENLASLMNTKNSEEFENILRYVMKNLSILKLHAEYYYDRNDLEGYLIVEACNISIDFPSINVTLGYDYAFSNYWVGNASSYFSYKNEYYELNEAIKLIKQKLKGEKNE